MSLISYLTRIHFADGVVEDALAEELARLGVSRPLILTDDAAAGAVEQLADSLPCGMAAAWHPLGAGPLDVAIIEGACRVLAETGADGLIGLGGPTALDAARVVGFGDGIARAFDSLPAAAIRPARHLAPRFPVLAVPTSPAGGLGLTPGVWIAGRDGQGRTLTGNRLLPACLLIDPTLGEGVPPGLRAGPGMDALALCIEAYLATGWNPPADGMALDGIRRAAAHLPAAVKPGCAHESRRELLAAGLEAGLAAQKGLGALHALVRALEIATRGTPCRGSLHAALLPPFLDFNAPAAAPRYPAIAAAMGLPADADLAAAMARFAASLGLPKRLDALGLDRPTLARVARAAEAEAASRTNPRLASAEDFRRILEAAA